MAFKMKGHELPGIKQKKKKIDPDAPGTPGTPGYEPPVKSMDYLTKTPNPTTKAVKNKNYKVDEKEEQVTENMSNAKDNNFDGHTEMKINKLAKDHNVSARVTEGSIKSQDLRRKENAKKKKKGAPNMKTGKYKHNF